MKEDKLKDLHLQYTTIQSVALSQFTHIHDSIILDDNISLVKWIKTELSKDYEISQESICDFFETICRIANICFLMAKDQNTNLTVKEWILWQRDIVTRKGCDYSKDEDKLSAFKIAGQISNIAPYDIALGLACIKIARLEALYSVKKVALNESISDSLIDLTNYVFFIYCLLYEELNSLKIKEL